VQITIKIKILPTKEQKHLIDATMNEYIKTVNNVASQILDNPAYKPTSKTVIALLPSALRDQCRLDAKSVVKKYKKALKVNLRKKKDAQKEISFPVLKKAVAIWNNQNYKILHNSIELPVLINGKSKRIRIKALITGEALKKIETSKPGTLRLSYINSKLIAQIAVGVAEKEVAGNKIMGVDLGLKVPAVAVTEDGTTKFFGNGRLNKYIKRKHLAKRKKLGENKKLKAIKKLNDKEQRWMKDKDHKVSRGIVDFAVNNNVSVIRLEKLTNIRSTARTSRKNEKNLHTWSFYRLAKFIEYKANLEGIVVEYVKPEFTSQKCPDCGILNKAKDRKYMCLCGYETHRDRLGAINIIYAPVTDGKSLSA
jgi:putative transposase